MRAPIRFLGSSFLLVMLAACGQPIVGDRPDENTPPVVEPIADLTTDEDVVVVVDVVLTDAESTDALDATAVSSDEGVVTNAGIVVGGSGGARTITITPVANASGTTTITVTIADDDQVITETFTVTVVAVDDPPTISVLGDLAVDEDGATAPIAVTIADVDTPLTAVTVGASSSDTALLPAANVVLAGSGAAYTVTLTPAPNGSGDVTVTVSAADDTSTVTESFLLTVRAVDDVPAISDIPDRSTNEDVATGPIPFTITDDSLATLVVTATTSDAALVPAANVTIVCDASGSCTVDVLPAPDGNGPVTITLAVSDGTNTAQDSFVLTVAPVDDAPLISAIADQVVPEDGTTGPLTFTVTAVDDDDSENAFTVDATSSNGTVIPDTAVNIVFGGTGTTRTIEIVPAADQFDATPITIVVTITDDVGLTASETFTVQVTSANDPATFTLVPGNQALLEDAANVLRNVGIDDVDAEDPEAGLAFVATSSDPSIVAVTTGGAGANRTVTLDPQLNRFGTVTITLVVNDGKTAAPATATFDVTVSQVNDAPTIAGPTTTVALSQGSGTTSIAISVADVDRGDGGFPAQTPLQTLSVSVATASANPNLVVSAVPDPANPLTAILLTLRAGEAGSGTLTLTVTDDGAPVLTGTTTVAFSVQAAPTIDPIPDQVAATRMLEDTPRMVSFDIADVDSGTLTVSATSSNDTIIPDGNLTFDLVSGGPRTVQMTITPASNQFGNGTTITVSVSDGSATATRTFLVDVAPVNDVPTISAIANQVVAEDSGQAPPYAFTVADVDDVVDCADVSVSVSGAIVATNALSLPNTGTVGQCAIQLTTISDAVGTMNLTLTVTDDEPSSSAPRAFTFTTTALNDPPTITMVSPDPQTTAEDTISGQVVFVVTDIDDSPCTLSLSSTTTDATLLATRTFQPACTAVGNSATRSMTVLPGPNRNGSGQTITVRVSDSGGLFASFTFTMNVTPVNDAPTISNIADVTVVEDASPAPTVNFTIADVDLAGAPDCAAVTIVTTNGPLAAIAITGSGGLCTATFTVPANANGTTTVTFTTTDTSGLPASDSFAFTVLPQNDPPTITAIANTSTAEDTVTPQIAFTVSDIDTPPCSLVLASSTSDATLFPASGRTFQPVGSCTAVGDSATRWITVLPGTDLFGTGNTITVTVDDGSASASTTFTLDVTPENGLLASVADGVSAKSDRAVDATPASDAVPADVGLSDAGTADVGLSDPDTVDGGISDLATANHAADATSAGRGAGGANCSAAPTCSGASHALGWIATSLALLLVARRRGSLRRS